MKEYFQTILNIYKSEWTNNIDKTQKSYRLIVEQLPNIISNILSNTQYKVIGSVGKGNKTKCPWISILNTSTKSAGSGLYIVYIFKEDMSGFYLCLMQGYRYLEKYLKNKFKTKKVNDKIQSISNIFKKMISDHSLSKELILLEKHDYVCSTIVSKYYPSNGFTSEELTTDLQSFINEYNNLYSKFKNKTYKDMIDIIIKKINVNQELFNYIKEKGTNDPMNDPDKHDGSYQITKKVLELYKELKDSDWNKASQNDLFFLLSCSLIRQKSTDKTIDKYLNLSLVASKTNELHRFFDEIWQNAIDGKYTNSSEEFIGEGKLSVGLFSRSHQTNPINENDSTKIKDFIKMCIELNSNLNDENAAIEKVKNFINKHKNIDNFQTKASQILHSVNPMFFPILNGPGRKIYFNLGINLPSPDKFENYAECCIATKSYRDKNFPEFKNYRVIDFYGSRYLKSNDKKDKKSINEKGDKNYMNTTEKIGKNTILFGPPGTGKTYNSKIYAVAICNGESIEDIKAKDYKTILSSYNDLINEERIAFTTFHQSYGYEEFIEGIQPLLDDKSGEKKVYYDIISGVFKKFCETSTKGGKPKPCVFIIDEINRGNISKIFGELITLIEESKREGAAEAMSCILPYSKEKFSVPDNVYILGTMNTADRSIAIMDTALRRRFDFIEMLPEKNILKDLVIDKLNISELFESINQRIELLYDRDHTIGHAYFMPLLNNKSIGMLKQIFRDRILPLLQEYFYEDYNKIRLVFGNNAFINEENIITTKYFKDGVPDGMLQEKRYTINDLAFDNIENYKAILLKKG